MNKEFVMRGRTDSGSTEVLNFSGHKPGYAYRLVEFQLYPADTIGGSNSELVGSITAGKTAVAPGDVNFNDEGLIGTATLRMGSSIGHNTQHYAVVNDTFLITQNLILMVQNTDNSNRINWQCRFVAEKMSDGEEAAANYRQFTISDG